MGRLHTIIVFIVLVIVIVLVCVSLDVSRQELRRPTFPERIFGLTQVLLHCVIIFCSQGIRRGYGSKSKYLQYYDTLIVPIIENTAQEEDLTERMAQAMEEYPDTTAVLVRRHGIYVWGPTWESAKTQCECYDYLFEIAIKMKQLGIDPNKKPENSEY
jgi:ribulose-5-phosphate 4-epimerase/fuculose-1-phosphate aldolase